MTKRMTHKQKLTLARSHMTKEEIKAKVSPWDSAWWKSQKKIIANRVKKSEIAAKRASNLRKARLQQNVEKT